MKRIFLFALIGIFISSCKDDKGTPTEPSVKAQRERNPVLFMDYNSNSQAAGMLEAIRHSYEAKYDDRLGHVNLVTNPTDKLYTILSDSLSANFGSPSIFSFVVNNETVDLVSLTDELDALINVENPFVGVVHTVRENDTAHIVDVKLEFFKDTVTSFISVETYQLVNVDAKIHMDGTYDLRQAADGTFLANTTDATIWNMDVDATMIDTSLATEIIFKKGDQFVHQYVPLRNFNKNTAFGTSLSAYTKFAPEFFKGDQLGLNHNPIRHHFLKEAYLKKDEKYDYPYRSKFLTIVWFYDHIELKYNIVNAYMK